MKVLLIFPPAKIWNMPKQIPLGLAFIGASLKRAGHEVEVFDMNVEKSPLIKKVKSRQFDLIGISATTPLVKNGWAIAETIKKYKNIPIVIGGPHPSALPNESLSQKGIDYVVRGEGEEAILEICQMIDGKMKRENILGLSYKKDGKLIHNQPRPLNQNLDDLPFPAYELFKFHYYSITQPLRDTQTKNSRAFYIMTSRGCPYGCVYCFKGINGRSWRPLSPEKVVAEWEYLVKELKATEIGVQDDVFNLDKKRAMAICNLLIEKKLNNIPWITNNGIRADKVDLELLQKMKEAGCKRVAFGVESGSQKVLNNIQKKPYFKRCPSSFCAGQKSKDRKHGFFYVW